MFTLGKEIRLVCRYEVDGRGVVVVMETLIGIVAIGVMTLLGVPIAHLRGNVGNLHRRRAL